MCNVSVSWEIIMNYTIDEKIDNKLKKLGVKEAFRMQENNDISDEQIDKINANIQENSKKYSALKAKSAKLATRCIMKK